jgi:hypothetical protein
VTARRQGYEGFAGSKIIAGQITRLKQLIARRRLDQKGTVLVGLPKNFTALLNRKKSAPNSFLPPQGLLPRRLKTFAGLVMEGLHAIPPAASWFAHALSCGRALR